MDLCIKILGKPKSKQSFRFTMSGRRYQPKSIKDEEIRIASEVRTQLPGDFIPFDEPLFAWVEYTFEVPKSFPKKIVSKLKDHILFKTTKPDVTDNLNKGLFDAMNKIVYRDDSVVSAIFAIKMHGIEASTTVKFFRLSELNKIDFKNLIKSSAEEL